MAIKINEMYGYQITYDQRMRRFLVEDSDGTELACANTQDEAEVKAKSLSKQEFTRIPIARVYIEGRIATGEVTSLNRDEKTAWVSMEKGEDTWGSGRQKISLSSSKEYYELTGANAEILESIKAKSETLNQIRAEIRVLIDTLEKPINLSYFGISSAQH